MKNFWRYIRSLSVWQVSLVQSQQFHVLLLDIFIVVMFPQQHQKITIDKLWQYIFLLTLLEGYSKINNEEFLTIYQKCELWQISLVQSQQFHILLLDRIIEIIFPKQHQKISINELLAIPLLDTLISELGFRFSKLSVCAMKLLYEAVLVWCSGTFDNQLYDVIYLYKERFRNHEVIDQELRLWKAPYDFLPVQHP